MLENSEIKKKLPHRYPFLLVDKIVEVEKGHRAVGIKNITANDFFCNQGYFYGDSVFPASLQVEAMAQMSGFIMKDLVEDPTKLALLTKIEKARFRKIVKPGDQLRIEVTINKFKANNGKFTAYSYIDGELASEVMFTCITVG